MRIVVTSDLITKVNLSQRALLHYNFFAISRVLPTVLRRGSKGQRRIQRGKGAEAQRHRVEKKVQGNLHLGLQFIE